jgi:hypothetical protein
VNEATAEEILAGQAADLIRETHVLPEQEVIPVVIETLHFMGKLVELFESEAPSVAKTAAVVLFVERMKLYNADDAAMRKVTAVVMGFQTAFAKQGPKPS